MLRSRQGPGHAALLPIGCAQIVAAPVHLHPDTLEEFVGMLDAQHVGAVAIARLLISLIPLQRRHARHLDVSELAVVSPSLIVIYTLVALGRRLPSVDAHHHRIGDLLLALILQSRPERIDHLLDLVQRDLILDMLDESSHQFLTHCFDLPVVAIMPSTGRSFSCPPSLPPSTKWGRTHHPTRIAQRGELGKIVVGPVACTGWGQSP